MGEQVPRWSFCGGIGRGSKGGESTRSCYEIRSVIDLTPRLSKFQILIAPTKGTAATIQKR